MTNLNPNIENRSGIVGKKKVEFLLFIERDGNCAFIKFWNEYEEIQMTRSSIETEEIKSRNIGITDEVKATRMKDSLKPFIDWASESKDTLDKFLKQYNITLDDIKCLKVTSSEPILDFSSTNLSLYI